MIDAGGTAGFPVAGDATQRGDVLWGRAGGTTAGVVKSRGEPLSSEHSVHSLHEVTTNWQCPAGSLSLIGYTCITYPISVGDILGNCGNKV